MQVLFDHEGRPIRLTDERLAHLAEHPEVADVQGAIEATLARPDSVVQSLSDDEVQLYYRLFHGTLFGDKFVGVVVKTTADDVFVLTAYLTDKVKRGVVLWSQSW